MGTVRACLGWFLLPAREREREACAIGSLYPLELHFFLPSRVCRPVSCHQGCLDLQRLGGERGQSHPPPYPPAFTLIELLREVHLCPPRVFPVSPKNRCGNRSWRRWDGFPAPLGLPNHHLILLPGGELTRDGLRQHCVQPWRPKGPEVSLQVSPMVSTQSFSMAQVLQQTPSPAGPMLRLSPTFTSRDNQEKLEQFIRQFICG